MLQATKSTKGPSNSMMADTVDAVSQDKLSATLFIFKKKKKKIHSQKIYLFIKRQNKLT